MLPAVPRKAKLKGPAEKLKQLIQKLPVQEDGVREAVSSGSVSPHLQWLWIDDAPVL
jgi:hypothetical protein